MFRVEGWGMIFGWWSFKLIKTVVPSRGLGLHEHGATAKPFPGHEKAFKLVKHPQLMGFFTRMNHSHCEFGGSIQLIFESCSSHSVCKKSGGPLSIYDGRLESKPSICGWARNQKKTQQAVYASCMGESSLMCSIQCSFPQMNPDSNCW